MNAETKTCQNCKQSFVIESEDFDFYRKIAVPSPTFCPDCRMKRRLVWRNERNLYKRRDDAIGKEIFAGFAPDAKIKIYEKEYWISDAWDPLQYGKAYDFSRSFFEQFRELAYAVPWPSRSIQRLINADYCDQASDLKNCYLCFNCDRIEDSAYVMRSMDIKNSFDLTQVIESELCYEGVVLNKCYRTFFSEDCEASFDVWFSKNCIGCTNCFGSANARNKSYYFFNEQLSKTEYEQQIDALQLHSWSGLNKAAARAAAHLARFPVKYFHGVRAVGSAGDYLRDTKNVARSWFVKDGQDIKYSQIVYVAKDSYDFTVWGNGGSLMYECLTCGEGVNGLKFCFDCWPSCRDLEYCISCRSSSDLFGCVGLQKKQYCIFNKQYSKEEYFALREKIIEHTKEVPYRNAKGHVYTYGEFFPEEFSPFAHNETSLGDTFPLTKEEVVARGYSWHEPEAKDYKVTMRVEDLPDSILDVPESVTNELISCAACKRAYRIIVSELAFFKRIGIPLPRRCVSCRLIDRLSKINKPIFYHRQCDCASGHFHGKKSCPIEFETSYAPDRPEIVYCEQCYNAEVV